MNVFSSLLDFLFEYSYWGMFLGGLFAGDTVVFLVGFLNSLGYFNLYLSFLFLFLGFLASDPLWYLIGRYGGRKFLEKFWSKRIVRETERFFLKRGALAVFLVKFVYGTRIITIVFAGAGRMNFLKFFFFDLLGNFVIVFLEMVGGYFLGYTIFRFVPYSKGVSLGIIFLILFFIIFKRLLRRKVRYEREN